MCNGTGHATIADRDSVERRHGTDAVTGGGDKGFISGVGVKEIDVFLAHLNSQACGKFHSRLTTDASQDILILRCDYHTILYNENIGASTFANVAVNIQQNRNRIWVLSFDFLLTEKQIDVIV